MSVSFSGLPPLQNSEKIETAFNDATAKIQNIDGQNMFGGTSRFISGKLNAHDQNVFNHGIKEVSDHIQNLNAHYESHYIPARDAAEEIRPYVSTFNPNTNKATEKYTAANGKNIPLLFALYEKGSNSNRLVDFIGDPDVHNNRFQTAKNDLDKVSKELNILSERSQSSPRNTDLRELKKLHNRIESVYSTFKSFELSKTPEGMIKTSKFWHPRLNPGPQSYNAGFAGSSRQPGPTEFPHYTPEQIFRENDRALATYQKTANDLLSYIQSDAFPSYSKENLNELKKTYVSLTTKAYELTEKDPFLKDSVFDQNENNVFYQLKGAYDEILTPALIKNGIDADPAV